MNMNLRPWIATVPWWGKIGAKLILARLPVDYKVWKHLRLFQCGEMEDPIYAHGVFKTHFDSVRSRRELKRFVGLELGPGDSVLSAVVAHAYGASAYHLVDVGSFAQADVSRYCAMARFLTDRGLPTIDMKNLTSREAILAACGSTYTTSGLSSLRALPNQSVDFVWSHSVLQHVRRTEFLATMRELRRILRIDGISSHWVDLQDCLGGALNNLRFRESVWESSLMAGSGFYTNRIRYSEMLGLFKEAGFVADVVNIQRWDRLPIMRSKLWDGFKHLSDEELGIRCFHVVLPPV